MLILITRWRAPRRIATGEIKEEVCRGSIEPLRREEVISGVDIVIFIEGVEGGTSDNGRNEFVVSGELALTGGIVGEVVDGSSR